MNTTLKAAARNTSLGFKGTVKVYEGERFIYSNSVDVTRLTREDAIADAQRVIDEHISMFDGYDTNAR